MVRCAGGHELWIPLPVFQPLDIEVHPHLLASCLERLDQKLLVQGSGESSIGWCRRRVGHVKCGTDTQWVVLRSGILAPTCDSIGDKDMCRLVNNVVELLNVVSQQPHLRASVSVSGSASETSDTIGSCQYFARVSALLHRKQFRVETV